MRMPQGTSYSLHILFVTTAQRTTVNGMHTGVGVGDASASATGALLLSIFQESMGRVATILFAHRLGTSLEPECKMYRLLVCALPSETFSHVLTNDGLVG